MNRVFERGSAIFIILLGVMLFAALSYAVSQMLRGGGPDRVTEQKVSVNADEIMSYGQTLRRGVQTIRISNGCEPEDVSFDVSNLTGYANGANTKCQVFSPDGGGVVYSDPPVDDYNDGSDWIFTGTNTVANIGSASPDLIAILPELKLSVCEMINSKLNIAAIATDAAVDFTKFQGTFASTQALDNAAGLPAGCQNYNAAGDHYFYYQVLIAR